LALSSNASARALTDDQGSEVRLPARGVRRVVSLVPSLTEAVAAAEGGRALIVGATNWCSHPADLRVERIGGTKNPDPARIAALRPDLVLANEEENRAADLDALRAAGFAVWVTVVRRLEQAFSSLDRMITVACGLPRPAWLERAEAAWSARSEPPDQSPTVSRTTTTAVIPIWRRPWMVLGRDTFAGDLLRRLGIENVYGDHPERYPAIRLDALWERGADLVVLPDEPYAFSAEDGPESFPGIPAALVSGRHLTWYGPSLAEAPEVLARQLAPGSRVVVTGPRTVGQCESTDQ
jgi:ABC-type Fe3+-hydroxamate transport system substrate-binding protein